MDSWFVSQPLRERLLHLGFTKIIMAGKSNYTFTIAGKKQDASQWKKDLALHNPTWGIDVPSCRVQGHSPTLGRPNRCFAVGRFFGLKMPKPSFRCRVVPYFQ